MRIHWLPADDAGTSFHQCVQPHETICKLNLAESTIASAPGKLDLFPMKQADVIVLQRWTFPSDWVLIRETCKAKVILDVDDDIWNLPENHHNKEFWNDWAIAVLNQLCKEADALFCHSPYMEKRLREMFPDQKIILPPYPMVNVDHRKSMPKKRVSRGDPRVGWVGSFSHTINREVAGSVLYRFAQKYEDSHIVTVGHRPECLKATVFDGNWTHYEYVPPQFYYPLLSTLQLDIGLAPMTDQRLDLGRSHLKVLDYGMFGTVPVVGNMGPFVDLPEDICIKVEYNQTSSYMRGVEELTDKKKRNRLSKNLVEWIAENYDINKRIHEWLEIFGNV